MESHHLSLGRGRRGPATIASTRPTRAPLGTPARVISSSSSPYSHIQIIAPASRGEPDLEDNQPTFTSPSYQVVAESALFGEAQANQVSLSPAPMRPTFAAKARAAELNAARVRKESRTPIEAGRPTVSSSSPVSLGAFTKFKPASRNRGNKIWKPLNLSDVYDDNAIDAQDGHHDQANNERASADDAFRAPLASSLGPFDEAIRNGESYLAAVQVEKSPEMAYNETEFDDQEWDPDLPSIREYGREPSSIVASRLSVTAGVAADRAPPTTVLAPYAPKSVLSVPKQAQQPQQIQDRTQLPFLHVQTSNSATSGDEPAKSPRVNLPKRAEQEAKLASLGVGPAAPAHDYGRYMYPSHYPSAFSSQTEDPFVDVGGYNLHNFNSARTTPFDYNAEYSRRKGTMDRDFCFPGPALYPPTTALQQQVYNMPFVNKEPASQLPYPMAYDGRAQAYPGPGPSQPTPPSITGNIQNPGIRSAKREQLLISLNNIAEASKARGQSRTVLYDPVSAQGHQPTDSTQTEPFPVLATKPQFPLVEGSKLNGLLEFSEELPWKDRPVKIHNEVMPSLSNTELAAYGRALEMGTMSNKQAATAGSSRASKYSANSTERIAAADKWFQTDNRGGAEILAYLKQVCENEPTKTQSARLGVPTRGSETPGAPGSATSSSPATNPAAADIANGLLAPLLVTLQSYLSEPPESQPRQFGRFGVVPEWCIDRSAEGSKSFFGEDWGAPPPRVGRDPRYRPITHEQRYPVYEEGPGAVGDGFVRRRW
ncbi:MAG: hypothetical protein M1812_005447 [Candelaria pacifica]|nr:MAG: hypothetical protein M1812_005447 [Candelaria pacifica]